MSDDLFDIFNDAAAPLETAGESLAVVLQDVPAVSRPPRDEPVATAGAPQPPRAGTASLLATLAIAVPDAPPCAPPPPACSTMPTSVADRGRVSSSSSQPEGGSSSSGGSVGGIRVITAASPSSPATGDGAAARTLTAPAASAAVVVEPSSRIRVRRATVSLEQFTVRLAEFPFATFDVFRGLARRGDDAVRRTCVGVVTRRSDPKQNVTAARASRYAVFTLWNMETASPSAAVELSFLLCGAAFDLLYSRLVVGAVVALSGVGQCARRSSAATTTDEVLLRVADGEAVRQLGFAADLGTCASISHKSQERCHAMVNTQQSQYCTYHVNDLRKVVRGGAGAGTGRGGRGGQDHVPSSGAVASPSSSRGGAAATQLVPSGAQQRLAVLAPGRAARCSTVCAPLAGAAETTSRLTASQQMLRQTSFLAVRGATGLPVEDVARRASLGSAGTGVYGGVQAGAALALRQQAGLRPASSYPSAQTLGVTSRGRDVLEAARQQAVHVEEGRLLRQTMRGEVRVGASSVAGGAPKRARVEAEEGQSTTLSSPATSASATAAAGGADGGRVEALRQQFRPLHRGAAAPFTPLSSHGAVHTVVVSPRPRDYRHSVVVPSAAAGTTAAPVQNALLRAAAKAAKEVLRDSTGGAATAIDGAPTAARSCAPGEGPEPALTLLGAVSDNVHSAHDHLRSEADLQQLHAFADKQMSRERALAALEAITEQKIHAHYCHVCRRWYGKVPTGCVEQHHRVEFKSTLKKYIKCEHCNYKTFVIGGDEVAGWNVYPRCPRCHQSSLWVRGDAAPQVAADRDAPPPS
ncbi:Primase zinc finger/Mcm10 replication factor [Novymonas esmeraldas]|uniref:Primase zinc finger/Mcm10 replication factor n=1 Tax=Novymonas esmeraldas TaxID=1808958 RepID=A0AAW0EXK6_9TRYP